MLNRVQIVRAIDSRDIFYDGPRDNIGTNSIDVRLGNWFFQLVGYKRREPVYECFYVDDEQYVEIPPNGVLLAMTKERCGARNWLVPCMKTRSSVERSGIDVCKSAGLGDIGYYDQYWTMEITAPMPSFSEPAVLRVGDRVAQIYFHESGDLLRSEQYNGQFSVDDWPLCILPKTARSKWEGTVFSPDLFRKKFDVIGGTYVYDGN